MATTAVTRTAATAATTVTATASSMSATVTTTISATISTAAPARAVGLGPLGRRSADCVADPALDGG